jgi:hypothetical protein
MLKVVDSNVVQLNEFMTKKTGQTSERGQPSLIFDKAEAYPSEAPFRCFSLAKTLDLIHKH